MKHEEMVLKTKQSMAASLKKLVTEKPLSKITISDIIKDCDVNRKTFYYHFEDIYDLLRWMLEEEAVNVVKHYDLLTEYKDAILFTMDYVEKNDFILNCIVDSIGHDELRRFLYNDFISLIRSIITDFEQVLDVRIEKQFEDFLADFYTGALANLLINWLKDTTCYTRQEVIDNITLIFKESLPGILMSRKI